MAVVKIRTFLVAKSPHPLNQDDMDGIAVSVNAFLATLVPTDVLDVHGHFAPGGKDGLRSAFITTVIYLV